ncbi:hypothetical protein ACVW0Y_004109, partial [Pseudomonas sp. TE3786]
MLQNLRRPSAGWDPEFRNNHRAPEPFWIPAYAGMTGMPKKLRRPSAGWDP